MHYTNLTGRKKIEISYTHTHTHTHMRTYTSHDPKVRTDRE